MIEVNNDLKLKSKNVRRQDVKITVENEKYKIKKLIYSFDGALFKTIMKQVEITDKTANQLKDKDINFKYGLYINDAFQYVDLGNFYIKDMEDDKKKEEITVTGYDRMIRFMKTFKQSELQLTYPCTIIKLVQKMCEVCETELYSTNFFNSDLTVNEDFFTNQELTYRDVLEKIAEVTLTTAFIKENKLYFCKPSNVVVQQLDKSYISNLIVKEKFGPLNALVLGRGSVEDNIESIDEESITQNGRCEIRFDENEFVQEQRERVIDNMFEQIKGLEYYSYEASDLGVMWLEPCDCIELGDRDGNFYKTYYLKANITLTTGITSNSEADIPDEADTKYKVTLKAEKKTLKVERLAKKNEGLIQDLIQESNEHSEKLTKHQQNIDSITDKVSNIQDFTRNITGIKSVELENCIEQELLELHIYGNNTVFKYQMLDDELYFNENLVLGKDKSILIVSDENNNSIEYDLKIEEVLRQNGEICDEYIIENGQAKIIRRINKDGTIKNKDEINELGDIRIVLAEGNNIIAIKDFEAKISVKWAIKSNYTDIFATRFEMNSKIEQTAEKVDINVNKKLEDYSKTTEMNAAIEVKADEINSKVNKKVGNDEIISKINQSAEQIQIQADKIDINGKAVNFRTQITETIGPFTNEDVLKVQRYVVGLGTLTSDELIRYDVTKDGKISSRDVYFMQKAINNGGYYSFNGIFQINPYSHTQSISLYDENNNNYDCILSLMQSYLSNLSTNHLNVDGQLVVTNSAGEMFTQERNNYFELYIDGNLRCSKITCDNLEQTSLETHKKNFEKLQDNALETIKQIDIYKYNLKNEKDTDKKHIGFVIGDSFNYSKEVTSLDNTGVDNYSFTSLCCKAIQEQQEIIEQLQEKIKEMEEKVNEKN